MNKIKLFIFKGLDQIKNNRKKLLGILAGLIAVGAIAFFVIFRVDTVQVSGSSYYTEDEIKKMVLRGPLAENSVLAPMIYSMENAEDIMFVDGINVNRVDNHTIMIEIEETELIGCFKFLDNYMYFDRQGKVIASSVERDTKIPFFQGVDVVSVAYEEEISFINENLLNTCITFSRIFSDSELIPDYIEYTDGEAINLQYGSVQVQLGQNMYLEDKMERLQAIMPTITGKKGILHLENITDDKKMITFEEDLTEEEKLARQQEAEQEGENSEGGTDSQDNGEDSGYNNGDNSGEDSGYNNGDNSREDSGYNNRYNSGEDSGYDNGYNSGEDSGYDSGSSNNYNNGYGGGNNSHDSDSSQ